MNILVVDDDPMILRLAHDILRASGHDVSVAKDGEVAWQSIRRGPPDLLLTDWLMPRVDGPELIARIRTQTAHREIYIIILSSRTGGDDIADGLEMGAHDYITKPFTARELNARIALADRAQRLARAAGEPLPSLHEFDPPPSQPIELPSASLPVLDRSMLDQLRQLDPGGGGQLLIEIAEIFVNEVPRMLEDLRSRGQRPRTDGGAPGRAQPEGQRAGHRRSAVLLDRASARGHGARGPAQRRSRDPGGTRS